MKAWEIPVLLAACCAWSGCLFFDCEGELHGVRHDDLLETNLERLDETGMFPRPTGIGTCARVLGDIGGSFRWTARLDGPGDGCADRITVAPTAVAVPIVPSGATLPGGCTGTWTFRVTWRGQGSILDSVAAGGPTWVLWREFMETSASGSCALGGGARSCGDFFVAPTRRVP